MNNRGRRAKRALSVAAIWLALVAMVFAYTDPDEYTYRYGEDQLDLIWESAETAQARQAEASARMDTLREEAAERTASGEWGREDMFGDDPIMLPARTKEPGLNLMWGAYEATVTYASDAPFSVCVAAVDRQAFVHGGSAELDAAPDGASVTFAFSLDGAAPGVMLAGDLPDGASISSVTVHKAGTGVFSSDLAAYAALAGALLTVLLLLSWDERPGSRERRRDFFLLACAALFASMPSLWNGMIDGHDLYFHLNRIEGIASGLRAGEFPVRIHSTTLLGYGYAAPEFYPELFLYLPAVMRNLGVSQLVCLNVFQMLVNLGAALLTYTSARRLFASRRIALGAALLYTLCIYRVVNLYVRESLGESVALIFFPVLIAAMADMIAGDERRWPMLALGMLGVFMSHLLSTLFAVAFCVLAALLGAKRLLREPRRILAILKAAALTVLCSLWFIVPFLQFSAAGINTNLIVESYNNTLPVGALLTPFSGNMTADFSRDMDYAYHVGVVPGAALLAGCALLIARLYTRGGALRAHLAVHEPGHGDKLALLLLLFGTLALLCATNLFPWAFACSLRRPISTMFMQVQFPWRLVGVASPMLALAAAYGYLGDERHAAAGMALLTALSVVFCGFTLTAHMEYETLYPADMYCDTRISQFEYTYMGTEKEALEAGRITCGELPVKVLEYERDGSSLRARIEVEQPYVYYDLPLLYYPCYRATVNGEESTVSLGTNNVLRIYNMNRAEEVELHVWFEPPKTWIAAQGASLAGALLLILLLTRLRKRGA